MATTSSPAWKHWPAHLHHRAGEGAVASQQGPGPGVELTALEVVVGHHRRAGGAGVGGALEAVDVPVGGQGVEEFLGRVGFHHPVVEAEALDGLGDPAGGVVDRGQADLGHLRSHLAPALGQLGPVFRVTLEQGPPAAAGGHRRVLGGVDEAQRGAGTLDVSCQSSQVAVHFAARPARRRTDRGLHDAG